MRQIILLLSFVVSFSGIGGSYSSQQKVVVYQVINGQGRVKIELNPSESFIYQLK